MLSHDAALCKQTGSSPKKQTDPGRIRNLCRLKEVCYVYARYAVFLTDFLNRGEAALRATCDTKQESRCRKKIEKKISRCQKKLDLSKLIRLVLKQTQAEEIESEIGI